MNLAMNILLPIGLNAMMYFGGYMLGKTNALKEYNQKHFDEWEQIITLQKKYSRCAECWVNWKDTVFENHLTCVQCAYKTFQEMIFTIPKKVWEEGAKAYDWAGHFEMIFKKKHQEHILCGLDYDPRN